MIEIKVCLQGSKINCRAEIDGKKSVLLQEFSAAFITGIKALHNDAGIPADTILKYVGDVFCKQFRVAEETHEYKR